MQTIATEWDNTTVIAAMRERPSTAEIQALFGSGLMTDTEVLIAAVQASPKLPEVRAKLATPFRASLDEWRRRLGDDLDDYT